MVLFAVEPPAWAACPALPGTNQVIIWEDVNFEGRCAVLEIGDYAGPHFGSKPNKVYNDTISSIRLGAGVSADLYQHADFGGVLYHYENGPFGYNLGGWAHDDVSSIKIVARAPNLASDTHWTFHYSTGATNSASPQNPNTRIFNLGTRKAGTTIRVGTCSGGGDLPSANAIGDTFLRVMINGFERASDNDGCKTTGGGSYLTYTLPYASMVIIRAGCYGWSSCRGTVEVAFDHPDSNGSIFDVPAAFNALPGHESNRNKLNFGQGECGQGTCMVPYDEIWTGNKHFQGLQRIPRTLTSTSDNNPRFVLSGSDNADIFTINFNQPNPASGLVGPGLGGSPTSLTKVIGVESNGVGDRDEDGRMHLGGLQVSGRWLVGGIEKKGGPGPSWLRFWDVSRLPNPQLVREVENTTGSAGAIALTKAPGQNQDFLMFVGGIKVDGNGQPVGPPPPTWQPGFPPVPYCPAYPCRPGAQVWKLSGGGPSGYGYANLATGNWVLDPRPLILPHEFPSINFVNQDNGGLYLVGTIGLDAGTPNTDKGTDTAVLMRVDVDATGYYTVTEIGSKVFTCEFDGSRQCAFNAAAGIFADPDLSALRLYAGEAWRPDSTSAPVTFVEWY